MEAPGLEKVRELLKEPNAWTKVATARDTRGVMVDSHHPDACAFCLIGACERAGISDKEEDILRSLVPGNLLGLWNDDLKRTHPEVTALVAKAILKAHKIKDRRKKAG